MNRLRRRAATRFIALMVVALVVAGSVEVTPARATIGAVEGPPCLLRHVLGEHTCPGCGLTRATALAARGEIDSAWSVHPAGLLVVALAVTGILLHLPVAVTGRAGRRHALLRTAGRALLLIGILGGWILRWS